MDPLSQVGNVQPLIERGPLSFVAAVFAAAFFLLLAHHFRHSEKLRKEHAQDLATVRDQHSQTVANLHKEGQELLRSVVATLHGYMDMMADVRVLAHESRQRREAKQRQEARRQREESAPTVLLERGGKP